MTRIMAVSSCSGDNASTLSASSSLSPSSISSSPGPNCSHTTHPRPVVSSAQEGPTNTACSLTDGSFPALNLTIMACWTVMSNQHTIRSTLTDDVVSKSGFGVIVTTSSRTTWILRRDRKCINFTLKLFELNEAWGKRWRRSHLGCGGFEKAHLLPVRPGAQKPRGISNTQLLGEHLCTYSHHNTTTIIITARSSTHCHGSADERRTPPTQEWTHTRDARAHTLSRYHARKAYRKQLKMVIPSTVLPVNSTCETQHVHRTRSTWHARVSALCCVLGGYRWW